MSSINSSKLFLLISIFFIFQNQAEPIKSDILFLTKFNEKADSIGFTKVLRDEYESVQKLKRKKIKDKFLYMNGYYSIDKNKAPFLYDTIHELCKRLDLEVPDVYVFAGNNYYNLMSYVQGADWRINAWASISLVKAWLNNPNINYIAIGDELINNCTYEEVRGIVAHELSHVKKNHVRKGMILSPIINGFTFTAVNLLTPLLPGFGFALSFGLFDLNIGSGLLLNYAARMPWLGISRKYEKEADLLAYDVTQNYVALINGLERLELIYQKKHPFWHSISTSHHHIIPFSSHPTNEQRAEYLIKADKKAKEQNQIWLKSEFEKNNKISS